MARHKVSATKALSVAVGTISLVLLVIVIWLDVATSLWQQTVILSGVAAGLLTFLLTALFLDGAVSRREHRKWAPVTRLALTDLLHTISDEEKSDLRRGKIVARSLPVDVEPTEENLEFLLVAVIVERDDITAVLARWAQFLASSADVQDLMIHIADLAENLDYIRDETVEVEKSAKDGAVDVTELEKYVRAYNKSTRLAIEEIWSIQSKLDENN